MESLKILGSPYFIGRLEDGELLCFFTSLSHALSKIKKHLKIRQLYPTRNLTGDGGIREHKKALITGGKDLVNSKH